MRALKKCRAVEAVMKLPSYEEGTPEPCHDFPCASRQPERACNSTGTAPQTYEHSSGSARTSPINWGVLSSASVAGPHSACAAPLSCMNSFSNAGTGGSVTYHSAAAHTCGQHCSPPRPLLRRYPPLLGRSPLRVSSRRQPCSRLRKRSSAANSAPAERSQSRVDSSRFAQVPSAAVQEAPQLANRPASRFDTQLEQHPDLVLGELDNGLRYAILPNRVPPNRFEAHLEVHVGSVDERENEQGMAHLVEHVTFLGSAKRERLLGTGARSNAYTDFHHTVFHVHSPLVNENNPFSRSPMLPQTLDALAEIAFGAKFHLDRISKERSAVVAEAQMMNTIEYRVDCQLLRYLHNDNNLGCRFPIGKVEQVPDWTRTQLVDFWHRWYFPANATLYIVGNFDRSVADVEDLVRKTFAPVPPGMHALADSIDTAVRNGVSMPAPIPSNGQAGPGANGNGASVAMAPKDRQQLRPPVEHRFGRGMLAPGEQPAPVSVFRHRLLHHFSLTLFCKLPVEPINTMEDTRYSLMVRLLVSVFNFRMNRRLMEPNMPTFSVEIDHSASAREGCTVSTLAVTSEPKDWKAALQVTIQEVRRMQRFGILESELECYRTALSRDSKQAVIQSDSVPSLENLDFLMEYLALGSVYLDNAKTLEWMRDMLQSITLEEVNATAASVLSFATHYRHEGELLDQAQLHPAAFSGPGPTRATAIIACIPAFTDSSGMSTVGGIPKHRAGSMSTGMHVDPAMVEAMGDDDEEDESDVPPGAVRFALDASQIADALAEDSAEVAPRTDVEVPKHLIPPEELEQMLDKLQPSYVPISRPPEGYANDPFPPADPSTGVVRRRLSNGIALNYMHTDNEPGACLMRISAVGGRAVEPREIGPAGSGVVAIGARALSESGAVGNFAREQIELFCVSELVNFYLDCDEEFLYLDCTFGAAEEGMRPALEMLHMFLQKPCWNESAMVRAKQAFMAHFRSQSMSLDRGCCDRMMQAMMGDDRRFRDTSYESIEALQLGATQQAVMSMLHPRNLEISIVGDFDAQLLERLVQRYLGTLERAPPAVPLPTRPVQLQQPPMHERRLSWHLQDSDERAAGYISGYLPNNMTGPWTQAPPAQVITPYSVPLNATAEEHERAKAVRRAHPLFRDVNMRLLTEVINSRLFTTVRDALNLTYDVTFELSLFNRIHVGWWVIHVTARPGSISDAVTASIKVLRNVASSRVRDSELARAKRAVLTRYESDIKTNAFMMQLITHLQSDAVPAKVPECLRDVRAAFEAATLEDLYVWYDQLQLADDSIFTCIGTSGPQAPQLPSYGSKGLAAKVNSFERTQTTYGQEAAQAANAGAQVLQDAERGNGKPGNAIIAALAAAMQSMKLGGAMQALSKTMKKEPDQPAGGK